MRKPPARDSLPPGIEWLLRAGLPADQREPIAGDLAEDYATCARRDSRLRATLAVWSAALRIAWRFRLERSVHGRPLPPIGDEIRKAGLFDALRQDLVFGARMLRRQPGSTAVAVLALALGIGANTTIFGIVDAVLWRALPYPQPDALVALGESRPREGRVNGPVAPADFYDWRRESRSFAAMAAYSETAVNLTGTGEPERLRGLAVSPGFLTACGATPARGRDFRPEEETVGRHRVVVLTDALWKRRFGRDASIVGRAVMLDGHPYEVIGILPRTFWWTSTPDLLVPLALDDHDRALRAAHFLGVIGRTAPGMSFPQAREEMAVIGRRLSAAFPIENANHVPSVLPLRDALVGATKPALLLLFGAVGLVLLIACANVATLLLARATARHKELAIRIAVGGARGRLVQQLLTESVMLSTVGGSAGLLLASWAIAGLRRILPAQFTALPGIDGLALDGRTLAAGLAASLATGIVLGIGPALIASDDRSGARLSESTRGTSGGPRGTRLRSALVVGELALSLMLLIGAGLLIVSFRNLMDVPPGFRPEQLITVRLTLPAARYPDRARAVTFYQSVFDRLRAIPGIERAAASSAPPFTGVDARLDLEIENRTVDSPLPVRAHPRTVSPDFFQAMGIPLLRGRVFTDRDVDAAPPVAIINQAAARQFWAGENPLGSRITLGAPPRWMEVVGVVGDVKHDALEADSTPEAYIPFQQPFTALGTGLPRNMTLVVRTSLELAAIAPLVRSAVAQVDPEQPTGGIREMDDLIAQSVAPQRLNLLLLSAFAIVAMALTAAGLYGVMAYVVTLRTREIGVRIALGATRAGVLSLILRQAGVLILAGLGLGLAGAWALRQSLAALLFGIQASDPVMYAGVSLLLAFVAFAAVAVPTARAARVDPLIALRQS